MEGGREGGGDDPYAVCSYVHMMEEGREVRGREGGG